MYESTTTEYTRGNYRVTGNMVSMAGTPSLDLEINGLDSEIIPIATTGAFDTIVRFDFAIEGNLKNSIRHAGSGDFVLSSIQVTYDSQLEE